MVDRLRFLSILREQQEWKERAFYPRELTLPVTQRILTLIGPRRAGKTSLLLAHAHKTRGLYLSLEDPRLEGLQGKDLPDMLRFALSMLPADWLYLDEIQNLPGWERAVRLVHDTTRAHIVLTGSSSRLLSREIATSLRGRSMSRILLPFSYREAQRVKRLTLEDYWEEGGFPEVVLGQLTPEEFAREYIDVLVMRDLVERYALRRPRLMRALVSLLLDANAREITARRLAERLREAFHTSKETVYTYLEYVEEVFAFFFLERYAMKMHERLRWPRKVYVIDPVLTRLARQTPDRGRLVETLVFLEFMRMRNTHPLLRLSYWRHQQGEVDFIIDGLAHRLLIQVTLTSELPDREVRGLKACLREVDGVPLVLAPLPPGEIDVGGRKGFILPLDQFFQQPEQTLEDAIRLA